MIYHNRYLTVTNIDEMAQYAFSNLEGWQDFSQKAKPGDILVISGKNFGCGSSRQQAVDCFKAIGVSMIIAESFGAIYERNAINSGFPLMTALDIENLDLRNGDEIDVDFLSGEIKKLSTEEIIKASPFSKVQLDIYQRGGLLE
ncbi:MAG: 3-isopropylmalate dehydratase [Candidatus Aminicenantes bacterium]|nr:3-isopropylmalate dehydratase [Candidatus Aminicenantes bacterium]